jgi:hypothetical protein
MKKAVWATTLCGLIAYSCSGTETQNPVSPLLSFKGSPCKKEANQASGTGTATAAQALVSIDYSPETAGLQCIAWEAVGTDKLKIDLYNFEGACGAQWTGKAAIENDGGLGLSLVNPECMIASCGWCIYDWSFEVEGVDLGRPLTVGVGIDTCPGEQAIRNATATLPVDAQSSGILCNYANFNALGWQALSLKTCGTLAMPCNGTSMCQSYPVTTDLTCQGDLVCSDNGNADERICAKPCSVDDDCGTLGVLECRDGLCRPKNNW